MISDNDNQYHWFAAGGEYKDQSMRLFYLIFSCITTGIMGLVAFIYIDAELTYQADLKKRVLL